MSHGGLLGRSDATEAALVGNLLLTGDMGYLRDGELFWTGRARERITAHGRKIDPSDFEPALLEVAELRPGSFVAFGVDDPRLGTQRVVIVSEIHPESVAPAPTIRASVKKAVIERLGVAVDEVILVKAGTLVKTSSGKRRHRHWAQIYAAGGFRESAIV